MPDNNIQLDWNTSSENNSLSFEVEHRADGISFNSIASIKAEGTSAVSHHYSYTDAHAIPGTNYYRLKQKLPLMVIILIRLLFV